MGDNKGTKIGGNAMYINDAQVLLLSLFGEKGFCCFCFNKRMAKKSPGNMKFLYIVFLGILLAHI